MLRSIENAQYRQNLTDLFAFLAITELRQAE
jgi:hypothetical protein